MYGRAMACLAFDACGRLRSHLMSGGFRHAASIAVVWIDPKLRMWIRCCSGALRAGSFGNEYAHVGCTGGSVRLEVGFPALARISRWRWGTPPGSWRLVRD